MRKWVSESDDVLLSVRIMQVMRHRRRSLDDESKAGEFYSIRSRDWAVVVPVSYVDGKRVMTLVRQYRHGSDSISVEFPCGNIEPGESPEMGAARELREETGMSFTDMVKIGDLSPNPAIMENTVHFFVAEGAQKAFDQSLDVHEQIELLQMGERDVLRSFMGQDREAKNAMMMACLMFYVRYLSSKGMADGIF